MACLRAYLVAAAVVGMADGPDPTELAARLGAPRFADREAAARALRGVGRDALPALRAAEASSDMEIRTRATHLVVEIQRDWLTTPTRIPLDFQNETADAIVKALDGRNGLRLGLIPPLRPRRDFKGPHRLTLRTKGAVTFWEAIDQFCEAGSLTPLPSNHFASRSIEPMTYLMPRDRDDGENPHIASGPFRVTLESLELEGNTRPGLRAAPGRRTQMSARVVIEAEPRMFAVEDGLCGWLEAEDDKGQSLVPPGFGGPRRSTPEGALGFYAMASSAIGTGQRFAINVPLRPPTDPGRTLKRLRGVMPVLLALREPGPLIVPIGDRRSGEARDDRVGITIGSNPLGRPQSLPFAQIDFTARMVGLGAINPHLLPFQIDVLDAEGTRFKVSAIQVQAGLGEVRVHLSLMSTASPKPDRDGGRPDFKGKDPVQLRFHHMFQAPAEVGFRFHDLPLP